MITLFKLVHKIDTVHTDNLILAVGTRGLRGHKRKLSEGPCLKDVKKYGFPYRKVD